MRWVSSLVFLGIATLMLLVVLLIFPHIVSAFFKYALAASCLLTLMSFVIAQRSHPGYLRRIGNSEESSVATLLKKVEPQRVCPRCEVV